MRTKIIATYGPAVHARPILEKVLEHADIIRINFSHGSEEVWRSYIDNIRRASKAMGKEVAILGDLPGPKIRLGKLEKAINLSKGDTVRLAYGKNAREGIVPLNYDIFDYLKEGATLSIGDGQLSLKVVGLSKGVIRCSASHSGQLLSGKGVTIRGAMMPSPPTEADKRIARFAARAGVDMIGLSYTQGPRDVIAIRKVVPGMMVIGKIERSIAVENVEAIAAVSDGIMIERGDLGLDVPLENLPVIQNLVITAAREMNKPVIVATQALTTMTDNPIPTRAEINDVANSVIDGADCLMLSEETAIGKYPIEALETLKRIGSKAEQVARRGSALSVNRIGDGIVFAAAQLAENYSVDSIFVFTKTGRTATRLSALMPNAEIVALTGSERARKMLKLYYGVRSEESPKYRDIDGMFAAAKRIAKKNGTGSYIVVSGPLNTPVGNVLSYVPVAWQG